VITAQRLNPVVISQAMGTLQTCQKRRIEVYSALLAHVQGLVFCALAFPPNIAFGSDNILDLGFFGKGPIPASHQQMFSTLSGVQIPNPPTPPPLSMTVELHCVVSYRIDWNSSICYHQGMLGVTGAVDFLRHFISVEMFISDDHVTNDSELDP
jgi:hypothetical protein